MALEIAIRKTLFGKKFLDGIKNVISYIVSQI